MSSEIAIKVENLSKCYHIYDQPKDRLMQMLHRGRKQYFKEFWAVHDVSFEIRRGETVGIIGRNGSGKSTLLQIICGTLNPSNGRVFTDGRIAALLELGSGFNPEFTGRENVYMNCALYGMTRDEVDQKFADILAFADIGDFIEQPVKTYSSGMMVRLAFSVIAHVNADILIIDEALAVGDTFFTQKCMRFLRGFMKTGTVLFVSHDIGSIKSLCNHAIWIEKGKVQHLGSPKEVCELYLEAFYEAQQGKSTTTKMKPIEFQRRRQREQEDQRLKYINASNLRNDMQIFSFDPEAASFGKGGAQIVDVAFLDQNGAALNWVVGGELVTLVVSARTHEPLSSPSIGFFIKDRLGQALFGDNTFLVYSEQPVSCDAGVVLQAQFTFLMPILPMGDYTINVALADGTQDDHVQHHWIHDAVPFKSTSSSVSTGLIGIPMHKIVLEVSGEPA
ncbi:ABC transporter ATP-binding protein [Zoogloea sp.]|uniref:ABC transporter ATP-binding protein n=1 Tax=Zoogloea sp. TaxID=49181 RepID=UPI00262E8DBA|nr:ABC transporter ATP-binding protein [Zoogloea sp.]MDD3354506.1 ABC transporter ATP-binding protein [Zoogloea sp.]